MKLFSKESQIACLFFVTLIVGNDKLFAQTPNNNNWQRIGPGGGGSTFIPTFSYQNPNIFLVRCDMTGSYLTKDGGESYQQINFTNGATAYAFDPADANKIYIGSNFLNKSLDGGKTWAAIFPKKKQIKSKRFIGDHAEMEIESVDTTILPNKAGKINNIRVDPAKKGNLYFSIGKCFYYSENYGLSWTMKNLDKNIEHIYTNANTAKSFVYIFTPSQIIIFDKILRKFTKKALPKAMSPAFSFSAGIFKDTKKIIFYALHHDVAKADAYEFVHSEIWTSSDLGKSWTKASDKLINNEGNKPSLTMIACAENDAQNAYVVSNNYDEQQGEKVIKYYGALKTNDAGKRWNWVWKGGGGSGQYGVQDANDASNLADSWVHKAFGGEFIQLLDVGVSPQNANIAVVTDWYRTMKTVDGGKTWKEIYSKMNEDGTVASRGMDVTTTYGVHFDPFNKNHLAISYTDIGYHHSFDGGKSWQRSVEGVPNEWVNTCYWVAFDPVIKDKLWSAWSGIHDIPRGKMTRSPLWKTSQRAKGGICVSLNGGKTWQPSINGMGIDSPTTSLVIDPKSPENHRTLYATVYNKGFYKSTDDGKTWTLKNKGLSANTSVFEITLAADGNLFLVVSASPQHQGGKKGIDFFSGEVYKSTDKGEAWTKLKITDGLLFPNGIEIDPINANRIYLACWSKIYLADLVGGDVVKANGGDKVLEMPGGIFLSEDAGATWKSIFDPNQYVYDITADPYHNGRLYCNTFNQAAYRSDDFGKTWKKIKGYDFHWGHRIIIDENDHEKVFISTFGSSVWHGIVGVF